jgi:outer membrane protein TolC
MTAHRELIRCLLTASVAGGLMASASAQEPARGEALQLGALYRQAQAADARARQIEQMARQSELRLKTIDVDHLPAVSVLGQTQYQSDSTTAPFPLPGGQPAFTAPRFTYDAAVRIDQRIYDPSIEPRRAVERAGLAESQARVRTALYGLRQEVNDAFFTAALVEQQLGALNASIDDLDARLRETAARVREGTALAGEAASVEAAVLRERQQADELRASRSAALARLGWLIGRTIDPDAPLTIPDLTSPIAQARQMIDAVRTRPEYEQFARTRDRAARQQDAVAAADRPQVSVFGRAGYGQPGLNAINEHGEGYALGGLQLQWKAWTWHASDYEREALAVQQEIVGAEEEAFTSAIRRGVENDLATIERLQRTAANDDRIVELRETVDRAARFRFAEGVTTAAEYVDRRTDWLTAQFDRARHRVELAYAQARLLTTLGLEVQ